MEVGCLLCAPSYKVGIQRLPFVCQGPVHNNIRTAKDKGNPALNLFANSERKLCLISVGGGIFKVDLLWMSKRRDSIKRRYDYLRFSLTLESLTWAVHLSNDNEGVLRPAQ